MGKLVFGINMTLDGCIDHREGVPSDEVFRWWTAQLDATGGMLWGRTVYELMEGYWPARADDPKASRLDRTWARKLNAKPKHVVSKRRDYTWANTFPVKGGLAAAIKALKKRTPRGLLLGSPTLAKELHRLGLIDEYFFVVNPRIAGHGPTLQWTTANLKFAGAKRFKSGALALRYRRG